MCNGLCPRMWTFVEQFCKKVLRGDQDVVILVIVVECRGGQSWPPSTRLVDCVVFTLAVFLGDVFAALKNKCSVSPLHTSCQGRHSSLESAPQILHHHFSTIV